MFLVSMIAEAQEQTRSITITDATATVYVSSLETGLDDINVRFFESKVQFSAFSNGLFGIQITSTPFVSDGLLQFRLDAIQVNGQSIESRIDLAQVETSLNRIVADQQHSIKIVDAVALDGRLEVLYQRQTPNDNTESDSLAEDITQLLFQDLALSDVIMPASSDDLNEADQNLLARANANYFDSNSFRFAFNGTLSLEVGDEFAVIRIIGRGVMADYSAIENLRFEQSLTLSFNLNDQFTQTIVVEYRIVEGDLYFRGFDEDTQRSTRWIQVPLTSILADALLFMSDTTGLDKLGFNQLLGLGDYIDIDLSNTMGLLQLTQFFSTTRYDAGLTDEAQFRTTVGLDDILDSKELVAILLSTLRDFGGVSLSEPQAETLASLLSSSRQIIVPNIDLEIDRFVDVETETLDRIEATFDLDLNTLTFDSIHIDADVVAQIAGYDVDYEIMAPSDTFKVNDIDDIDAEDVLIDPAG